VPHSLTFGKLDGERLKYQGNHTVWRRVLGFHATVWRRAAIYNGWVDPDYLLNEVEQCDELWSPDAILREEVLNWMGGNPVSPNPSAPILPPPPEPQFDEVQPSASDPGEGLAWGDDDM
jgi:hypothetical protein